MENENKVHEAHPSMIDMFIQFWTEIFDMFKYIFNDVFLGIDP